MERAFWEEDMCIDSLKQEPTCSTCCAVRCSKQEIRGCDMKVGGRQAPTHAGPYTP